MAVPREHNEAKGERPGALIEKSLASPAERLWGFRRVKQYTWLYEIDRNDTGSSLR